MNFDKTIEAMFADQEDGTTIFYPNGICMKGRVVACEKRKNELFRQQKRKKVLVMVVAALNGAGIVLFMQQGYGKKVVIFTATLVTILLSIGEIAMGWFIVKDLPVSPIPLQLGTARAKSVRSLPLYFWKFTAFFGVFILLLYFLLYTTFPDQLDPRERTQGYMIYIVVIAGFISFLGISGLRSYKRGEPTLGFRRESQELIVKECEKDSLTLV